MVWVAHMRPTRGTTTRTLVLTVLMTLLMTAFGTSAARASAQDCNPEPIILEHTCAWIEGTGTYVDGMKATVTIGAGKVVYGYFRFTGNGVTVKSTTAKYYETSSLRAGTFGSGWQSIDRRYTNDSNLCAMFRYRKSGVWYTWQSTVCFNVHS